MKDDFLLRAARILIQIGRAILVLASLALTIGFLVTLIGGDPIFASIEAELEPEGVMLDGRLVLLFVLGLSVTMLVLVERFLARLLAIIRSIPSGDPFQISNANNLEAMGWLALAMQALSFIAALYSLDAESIGSRLTVHGDISIEGLFLVLLLFILARVFRHGTAMRDDLAGTV